jgi:hypothetical protein
MDLSEKIKEVKELIKSLLLLGDFEIIPAFDSNYDLIIEKCFTVTISLNHHVKQINYPHRSFPNDLFDLGSFTSEEKGIVYHFVINGGTKIMLQEKKKQIEALKKEVESLELIIKTQPTNES